MDRLKLIMELNAILLDEMPQYKMQAKSLRKILYPKGACYGRL